MEFQYEASKYKEIAIECEDTYITNGPVSIRLDKESRQIVCGDMQGR